MTTKTTDLWLSRDPDGSYWMSDDEPQKIEYENGDWKWSAFKLASKRELFPDMLEGTKLPIRVTVEVLR